MDGHHVALILDTLLDKRLRPGDITNATIFLATGTDARRIHQHVVIALEACLDHSWKVTTLLSCLIDRNTEGSQSWEIHEQVVDHIAETGVEMTTDDST